MSTVLTEVEDGLATVVDELRAKADKIEQEFKPVVHDGAEILARMGQSPIIAELMQLAAGVLPTGTEQAIVTIIRDAGEAAAKVAAATAQPVEPAPPRRAGGLRYPGMALPGVERLELSGRAVGVARRCRADPVGCGQVHRARARRQQVRQP